MIKDGEPCEWCQRTSEQLDSLENHVEQLGAQKDAALELIEVWRNEEYWILHAIEPFLDQIEAIYTLEQE